VDGWSNKARGKFGSFTESPQLAGTQRAGVAFG
jgi:hypothetical protein